jgi:tetratricopeptide (TPR) repeat protein
MEPSGRGPKGGRIVTRSGRRTWLIVLVSVLGWMPAVLAQEPVQEAAPPPFAEVRPVAAPEVAEAAEAPAEVENPPQLVAIPEPDLSELEPAVAQQLTETRRQLEALFSRPGALPAERAEAFGELGRLYQAYGLSGPAEAAYVDAHLLAPNEYRWAYYLGYLYQQVGSYENAAALYGRALEIQQTVAAVIHLAEVYVALERLDDAEKVLRYALSGAPELPSARALLGQIALSRKDYALAADYLEAALAAVPEANRLHYPLALAYRGLGDLDKAQEHLARRGEVGVRPADPLIDELEELKRGERVHVFRGRTAFRAGDFDAAAREFRQAVEADPESVTARVNLGSALGQAGDRIGAIHHFRKALELDPKNATAQFNLGVLLGLEGAADEALEHLETAAELEPGDGEIQRELAAALLRLARPEEALKAFRRASDLAPFNPDARLGEVQLLVNLGRFQEAYQRLDETYSIMPREPRVVNALVRFLAASPQADLRDGERAVDLGTRLFQAEATVEHGESLALALAEAGRCQEAADMLGKVVDTYRRAGETAQVARLETTVARYQAGSPCQAPSLPGD